MCSCCIVNWPITRFRAVVNLAENTCMPCPINFKNVFFSGIFNLRGYPFMTSTRRGRGLGSGGRMWTGKGGPAPCGRPHRKLKLESIDVILSSSHAKKLVSFFYQNFVFGRNKYLRYKLVIKIIYTVLNKLQSYSRISALGPAGHFA